MPVRHLFALKVNLARTGQRRESLSQRPPTILSRIVWRILSGLYRWKGWRLDGTAPDIPKYIILGAPHTSNWDFVFFAGGVRRLGIAPNFIGKHTLFKWPMTRFMKDMGGIPVDRTRRGKYVEAVIEAIHRKDRMALVIAPEGSRTSDGRWRSGFWHIARGAGIPIVPAWVDNATMKGGIGEPVWTSDDFHADLARLAEFYRQHRPDCERFEMLVQQAKGEVEDLGRTRG